MRPPFALVLPISMALLIEPANSEFAAAGKFEGSFCTSYLIFSLCAFQTIDATVDSKGALYTLPSAFESVDEFNDGRCWIKVHSSWWNWFRGDVPVFYSYNDGDRSKITSYKKLGTPEYIVFQCIKR
jgi:hypothetical protein